MLEYIKCVSHSKQQEDSYRAIPLCLLFSNASFLILMMQGEMHLEFIEFLNKLTPRFCCLYCCVCCDSIYFFETLLLFVLQKGFHGGTNYLIKRSATEVS